jgi:hypothetical protein
MICTWEYKPSLIMQIPYKQSFRIGEAKNPHWESLVMATRHQNLVGWDMFLHGYLSTKWHSIFVQSHSTNHNSQQNKWDSKIIKLIFKLTQEIWAHQNSILHGANRNESAKKLRNRLILMIRQIYDSPPKLHSRYPRIQSMSFEDRIKQHNTYLQRWIAWIPHQVTVSKLIYLKIARCNLLREKRRAKRNWQARFAKSCQQKDFHAPTTPTPKEAW